MCTVTFLPRGKREFILTSNRDESVERLPALPVQEYVVHDKKLFFPMDQQANGTWIASEINGYTLCLLNGAFEKHEHKPPYRKSRGLMVLDFFQFENPAHFVKEYDFSGIEPFMLIFLYSCPINEKRFLHEMRWDGQKTAFIQMDASLSHIWSSATLYTKEVIQAREIWFEEWNKKHESYSFEDVLFFHHFGGNGSKDNDLIMDRNSQKTVSITCFDKSVSFTDIIYEDLIKKQLYRSKVINQDEASAGNC